MEFNDYILNMWKKIGYSPENVELSEVSDLETDQQDGGIFTPSKSLSPNTVQWSLPKEVDHGEIIEFIVRSGLLHYHYQQQGNCYNSKLRQ